MANSGTLILELERKLVKISSFYGRKMKLKSLVSLLVFLFFLCAVFNLVFLGLGSFKLRGQFTFLTDEMEAPLPLKPIGINS